MSTLPTAASLLNFQSIFHASLKAYEKQTKKDLLAHPLAARLNSCDSPADILAVLQDQVFSPAKVIFAGAGVLLLAAKDVRESQDALVDVFERIENFFKRLETYTEVPPTAAMTDIIMKIMVEVLGILAISTKEIKQGRTKKYLKKLAGRTELDDALKRLDKLTQEEARMAAAQLLKIAHNVENKIIQVIDDRQRQELRRWVSPPDPSTNHNITCDTSHKQTATWFFEGN
ncbi:hypothetical protein EDB86DRAFT_3244414, partial [Lactarius hatsudake]